MWGNGDGETWHSFFLPDITFFLRHLPFHGHPVKSCLIVYFSHIFKNNLKGRHPPKISLTPMGSPFSNSSYAPGQCIINQQVVDVNKYFIKTPDTASYVKNHCFAFYTMLLNNPDHFLTSTTRKP